MVRAERLEKMADALGVLANASAEELVMASHRFSRMPRSASRSPTMVSEAP